MSFIVVSAVATANNEYKFKVDNSIRKYTLQIEHTSLDVGGVIALFQDYQITF